MSNIYNLFHQLKTDIHFRIKYFLFLSLILNFAYALFLFIVSQLYRSKWFFVMSIYYTLLSLARLVLFSQINPEHSAKRKLLIMRACGFYLFILNLSVSAMMLFCIYTAPPVRHHEITVITLATYTFSALTLAIVSGIKQWKQNNPVYSCVKTISLISASVSLVTLTNTMLTTFGEDTTLLRNMILPILSIFVIIFIVACAVLMIRKANAMGKEFKT